jgi:hypothetical protein
VHSHLPAHCAARRLALRGVAQPRSRGGLRSPSVARAGRAEKAGRVVSGDVLRAGRIEYVWTP